MMLCLDAGNSLLKFGFWDNDDSRWIVRDTLAYDALDRLEQALPHKPTRLLICNVAGPTIASRLEQFSISLGLQAEWFRSSPVACGVNNGYALPTQLGADRWAALIGARAIQPGNVVVVMSGTATTIDVLDASGTFRGGVILPGLGLMRQALAKGTAGLPLAAGKFDPHPRNTDDAITSGAIHATLGAIERIAAQAFGTDLQAEYQCLVSGGAAASLSPHLRVQHRVVDNLVLEGLARYGHE
jgi:type III pantothenate kinase